MSNIVTGRQLRAARVLAGLSQRQLAQAVGVHERAAGFRTALGLLSPVSTRHPRRCVVARTQLSGRNATSAVGHSRSCRDRHCLVARAFLQALQHARTIAAAIKVRRLGKPTVQNLRQPDHHLKIELGPFGHHAVKYFAAVPLPRAIETGKEFLSEFLG
jgi:hypothetical protein